MAEPSRRQLLSAAGLLAGAAAVGGCNTAPSGGTGGGDPNQLRWWDHFNPLQDLHKEMFAEFEKDTGVRVQYTPQQTQKMGQALQLAKQSNQLPDIHSNVGLELPLPALIDDGWYQPIQLSAEAKGRLPEGSLIEGVTIFGGEIYSIPIFTSRQYATLTWFNTEMVQRAGLDPSDPPRTYDEFRAAARQIKKRGGDNVYGWMLALGQPSRLREQINALAEAGGFEGQSGRLFRTGEFNYENDAYVNAIEFWLAMEKDGVLVPGTQSFSDKVARARWAAGTAGYYFDGPWCAGVVSQDLAQFVDKLEVGPMLVPEEGMPVTAYNGPAGGAFWLSGQSSNPEAASKLLGRLTTREYYIGLAANMDQPPLDLTAVEEADVLPSYKKLVGYYQEDVFLAPVPVVGNVDITKVEMEAEPLVPTLGETIQGLFSGDLPDVRKALADLSARSEQNREEAMAKAKKKGAKVSLDDYAFPNWEPRQDYTPDMYDA